MVYNQKPSGFLGDEGFLNGYNFRSQCIQRFVQDHQRIFLAVRTARAIYDERKLVNSLVELGSKLQGMKSGSERKNTENRKNSLRPY